MEIQTGGNSLAEFDAIEAGLVALKKEHANKVYDVTTPAGMKEAVAAVAKFRTGRTDLEKVRKALKQESLEYGRTVDSKAKRIKAAFMELEGPPAGLIKAEKDKKDEIKAEEERKEQARIDEIRERISRFEFTLSEFHPSDKIKEFIAALADVVVDDSFGELEKMAGIKKAEGLEAANAALALALNKEQVERNRAEENRRKEAELAASEKRLSKERADEKAKQDEKDKIRAEQKARDDAALATARKELEEKQAAIEHARRAEELKEIEKRKAAEKAATEKLEAEQHKAELSEAKCDTLNQVMENIGKLCIADLTDAEKVAQIEIIVEANL